MSLETKIQQSIFFKIKIYNTLGQSFLTAKPVLLKKACENTENALEMVNMKNTKNKDKV